MTRNRRTPQPRDPATAHRLSQVRQRDTALEKAIRSELHRRGMRFRVQARIIPGLRRTADIVFRSARVAVFVDGCFWHCCPVHATYPKSNADWWRMKLEANVARDRDTDQRLRKLGWLSVRIWEHENVERAVDRVATVVHERQAVSR
jgi:DNA mismatch endonuclease (patch repair protein)